MQKRHPAAFISSYSFPSSAWERGRLKLRFASNFNDGRHIMALTPIFDFLKEAVGFIKPDSVALDDAGEDGHVAIRYHKRIVIIAGICGVITAIGGTVECAIETKTGREMKLLLFSPFIFGTIGTLFGVAAACLFAPRAFLEGPVGSKWMGLIGTRSIVVARVVCAILAALPIAFGLFVWWKERSQ